MYVQLFSTAAALAALSNASHGAIISATGDLEVIAPPAFVTPGTNYATSPFDATGWDEQQGVVFSGVSVDMINNPGNNLSPTPGTLTTLVDSHFFHFHDQNFTAATGSVTFSGTIVGVDFNWANLGGNDPLVQPPGTTYDNLFPRGLTVGADFISINGNVLTFDLTGALQHTAQFRVFTETVPTPGAAALLGTGGLICVRRRRAR